MSSRAIGVADRVGPVIEAAGLWKSFGEIEAVRDLSFRVDSGKVVGLLGPNGAGKSTAVHMMTTLTSIDSGSATVGGFDVRSQPDVVRQLIGLAGQAAAVDEKLSARENLELFARLYKIPRSQRRRTVDDLVDRFDMGDFADRPAETYSGGQRRRLDVVAALVATPPALFLDEPTTGLDPRSRADIWDAIEKLASEGTAIVLTTQYLEEADRLADSILIIDEGRTVAEGDPETLKRELQQDVLDIHVADDAAFAIATEMVNRVEGVVADAESRQFAIPAGDDVTRSLELLADLQRSGVSITDFQLRHPTLDDVFLQLTGSQSAEPEEVPT